jgi:hypothetical protein
MNRFILALATCIGVVATPAVGALVLTQTDGAVARVYNNGGGAGFGGTLGNGAISMDAVAGNLVVGFAPGNALNDIVALYLDTKSGGFVDADMRDHADGGRTVLSELTLTKNDVWPAGVLPDFGVAFGNFGAVLFELNAGSTDGHLNFLQFNPSTTISIPLSTLGNPLNVDFFAGYASGGGYNSNESLPFSGPLNSNGNPGFGDGQFGGLLTGGTYENFDRFVTAAVAVPEPGTFAVWGLMLVGAVFGVKRFMSTAQSA